MKKVVALIASSIVLVYGSRCAFLYGVDYDLGGFNLTPEQRMSLLDTTMIAEKWIVIGSGMMTLATALMIVAMVLYFVERRKAG